MSAKYKPILITLAIVFALGIAFQITNNESRTWTLEDYKSQGLDWRDCYDGYECSSFRVPIDYENIDDFSECGECVNIKNYLDRYFSITSLAK